MLLLYTLQALTIPSFVYSLLRKDIDVQRSSLWSFFYSILELVGLMTTAKEHPGW